MKFSILEFFKEPEHKDVSVDKDTVKKNYDRLRPQLFLSCFVAYFTFYLCKKNLAVAIPGLSTEYSFTNVELGFIGSSFYLIYGLGKFVNGVLITRCDVQKILPAALLTTAFINILIVLFSLFNINSFFYLLLLVFLWGMNGWIQSIAFPSVIKILTFWTTQNERGTVISLWSPSHLLGIFVSALLSGFLVVHYGWRMVFLAPALIAIIFSFILFFTLKDKPQSLGLPEVEKYFNIKDEIYNEKNKKSVIEILKSDILCNKVLWLLAIAYIFVYIIRLGTEDWLVKYLYEVKGNSIDLAAQKLCILPLVGIVGSVFAGVTSDRIFKGKRLPVNLILLIIIIISFILLKYNTVSSFDFAIIALLGIGIYGVQILIGGLCAIESTSKEMSAAAAGFTGLFGYAGAFLSSISTGFMIDNFGWNGAIFLWIFSAVTCFVLCILIKKLNK